MRAWHCSVPSSHRLVACLKPTFSTENNLKLKLKVIADVIAMLMLYCNVRFLGHMLAKLYLGFMRFYWENRRGKTIGQSRAA